MDQIKYDEVNDAVKKEAEIYSDESAKEIRWTISKLQSDISYFEFQAYIRKKKINALNEKYIKIIEGKETKDASVETK